MTRGKIKILPKHVTFLKVFRLSITSMKSKKIDCFGATKVVSIDFYRLIDIDQHDPSD